MSVADTLSALAAAATAAAAAIRSMPGAVGPAGAGAASWSGGPRAAFPPAPQPNYMGRMQTAPNPDREGFRASLAAMDIGQLILKAQAVTDGGRGREISDALRARSVEVDEYERAGVEAREAAGVAPEEAQWILLGPEGSTYTLPPGTPVRFGKDGKWVEKVVGPEGKITAGTDVFGSDPIVGVVKEIWKKPRAVAAEAAAEATAAADEAAAREEAIQWHAQRGNHIERAGRRRRTYRARKSRLTRRHR